MKAASLIIIAVIALSANAGHLESIFEEVTGTEFGKTMVQTIELQLQTGESVDGLIDSVRGVSNGLKAQLAQSQSHHEEVRDACDGDVRDLGSGLTQSQSDVRRFSGLTDSDSATLESRNDEVADKERQVADRASMLGVLGAQREKEAARYANLQDEYRSVVDLLEDVRVVMQNNLVSGGGEFLQTNTAMQTAVLAKLKSWKSPEQGVAHAYGSFFKLLASVVEKSMEVHSDQAIVARLFAVCDRIEENVQQAATMERDAERQRQDDFDALVEKINGQVNYVNSQLVTLRATVRTLEDRVAANTDRVGAANQSVADYTARMQDRMAECASNQAQWENYYHNIMDELSTAGKLTYLLEDKRALLARYGL